MLRFVFIVECGIVHRSSPMETGSYQTDPEADNAAAASGLSANNITTVLIRVMERIVVKQHSIITQSLTQLI